MNRGDPEQDLKRFAADWIAAEARGDVGYLERALADDFVAVGPLGFMMTKPQWIGRHQGDELKYQSLDLDQVTVRRYDDTTVLICRQVQQATYRGNPVPAELRTTVILVRRDGRWQVAGVHMSPIGQPPTFAPRPARGP